MHSTGARGLCPRCLFACTTVQSPGSVSPDLAGETAEILGFGQAVGPDDRFLLLDKLGEGGMGEVWLATDQALSVAGEPQLVALKFLSHAIRQDAKALAHLRTEVLRSQRLNHPNIVRIFDLHTHKATPFIKMEYVEGNSLRRWLDLEPDGVMPWRMVANITSQLVSALEYAHVKEGVVHRDLKPSNLLLSQQTTVKLTDFGIAVGVHESSRVWGLGTLSYASPQQLTGLRPAPEDDIYALGATLYELLTGSVPLDAESQVELVQKVLHEVPPSIPKRLEALRRHNEVPAKMLILVQRCLEKDPLSRPKTHEIARLLAAPKQVDLNSPPLRVPVPSSAPWIEPPSPPPKRRLWPSLVALTLATLTGLAVWQNWGWIESKIGPPSPPAAPPPSPNLSVTSDPSEAEVDVEWTAASLGEAGRTNATTPFTVVLKAAEFRFRARKAGYLDLETNALFNADRDTNVHLVLAKKIIPPPPRRYGNANVQLLRVPRDAVLVGKVYGADGQPVGEDPPVPAGSGTVNFEIRLLEGKYSLGVRDTRAVPAWTLKTRPFVVQPEQTTNLQLAFAFENLKVTSEPFDAEVSWPREAAVSQDQETFAHTPFTHRFRFGEIYFGASKRGYIEGRTNYVFLPAPDRDGGYNLHLTLLRKPAPLNEDWWTNSLKMVFRRVDGSPFWACTTETRVSEFRQFVKATAYYEATNGMSSVTAKGWERLGYSWENPGFPQTDDHPVIGVSWDDANRFCVWLTGLERGSGHLLQDQTYRLPRTNEWARLVGAHRYPWGDDPDALSGSHAGNYSGTEVTNFGWASSWPILANHTDRFPRTSPVVFEDFKNLQGFFNLGGNAAEWCEEQVLCGGSWYDGEWSDPSHSNLQSLETGAYQPMSHDERHDRNGFRVIVSDEFLARSGRN
jgi:serine/threonine protein kinase/formylglycine-generating enzyme required for sulfatase activity